MLPWVVSLVAFFIVTNTGGAIDYTSTRVIREKFILYDNTRFLLEAQGSGNDTVLYMTIYSPITKEDNFSLSVVAKRFDGVEILSPDNSIFLCDLLLEESRNSDTVLSQLRLSRVFNMEGMLCPIQAGTKRLMAYMSPPKFSLHSDIGCGTFTYETTMESCQGRKPESCRPFITASTLLYLSGDHCSNTSM